MPGIIPQVDEMGLSDGGQAACYAESIHVARLCVSLIFFRKELESLAHAVEGLNYIKTH